MSVDLYRDAARRVADLLAAVTPRLAQVEAMPASLAVTEAEREIFFGAVRDLARAAEQLDLVSRVWLQRGMEGPLREWLAQGQALLAGDVGGLAESRLQSLLQAVQTGRVTRPAAPAAPVAPPSPAAFAGGIASDASDDADDPDADDPNDAATPPAGASET